MSAPNTIRVRRTDAPDGATYRAHADAGALEFLVLGTLPPNDPTRLFIAMLALALSLALVAWDVRFFFVLMGSFVVGAYALRVALRMARRWSRRVHIIAMNDGLHVDAGLLENAVELTATEASRLRIEEQREARQRRYPLSTWWLIAEGELGERIEAVVAAATPQRASVHEAAAPTRAVSVVVPLYDEASARWAVQALREFFARHEAPTAAAIPDAVRALGPRPTRITITEPHEDLDRQCGCSNAWTISIRWGLTRRVVASTVMYVGLLIVGGLGLFAVRHPFFFVLHLLAAMTGLIGTVISLRNLEMGRKGVTRVLVSDQGVQWWTAPFRMSHQPAWPKALRFTRARALTSPVGDPSQVVITQADGISHTFEPALTLTQAEADYLVRAIASFRKRESA